MSTLKTQDSIVQNMQKYIIFPPSLLISEKEEMEISVTNANNKP